MVYPEPHSQFEQFIATKFYKNLDVEQQTVYKNILCGAFAGICAKTFVAPIERVKMSFQVSENTFTMMKALQLGRSMVKEEGVISLWKGHSAAIMRIAPYSGISFAIHDYSEDFFKDVVKSKTLPASLKFVSGALAGFFGTVITYPLDVLRVRLALGKGWKNSLIQGGFVQGLFPTLLGIVPYSGITWWSKQTILENYTILMKRKPVLVESFAINACAGLAGQFITYPLDIVRRRMQMEKRIEGVKLPSTIEMIKKLIKNEGIWATTKGFSLNIIKGPIAMSISLTVYDLLNPRHLRPNIS